jgi:hypothetical protein
VAIPRNLTGRDPEGVGHHLTNWTALFGQACQSQGTKEMLAVLGSLVEVQGLIFRDEAEHFRRNRAGFVDLAEPRVRCCQKEMPTLPAGRPRVLSSNGGTASV